MNRTSDATLGVQASGRSPSADARRVFSGIASSYDRVGALLSLGQDPRWRRALVNEVRATRRERVLDVATGTGLVAMELRRRYACRVVGLDRSAEMLAIAARRDGRSGVLVHGRAERLPFADESFDHVTFSYLLRYVDDPPVVLCELARVLRPGGRLVALDFGVPGNGALRGLWKLYTRAALPLAGRLVSRRWAEVASFLGPSIESFQRRHPPRALAQYWSDAGIAGLEIRRPTFGAAVLMTGTKRSFERAGGAGGVEPGLAPAFYALAPGGWRDYWTLLHPPYTAWHLSYVLLAAALVPAPDPRIVLGAVAAFGLAVGVGAHAFDELRGRPLRTRIPRGVLAALGVLGLGGAVALGLAATALLGWPFLLFVASGLALVVLYAVEAPLVHTDVGFALSWGAFPVLATAYAVGASPLPALVLAAATALLSLAQRRLSSRVRAIRRRAESVSGEVRFRDGSVEALDARALIGAADAALRILWLAVLTLALGMLLSRWL